MTQEFHISVTPVGNDEYLVRTERVAPGVPLAEEQVLWTVDQWLAQARELMNDPLLGLLQGNGLNRIGGLDEKPGSLGQREWNGSLASGGLLDLGKKLYNALFQGTLRDSWMTAQGIAQHRGEMLRLRLGLKGVQLPRLPWEVLNGGDRDGVGAMRRPIATGTDIVFSRYQPGIGMMGGQLLPGLEADQPIRILMAIAAPTDQERLDLKREATNLQQELRNPRHLMLDGGLGAMPEIQLTVLDQPGREQLTQAIEQGQYHVLHYAGHSNLGVSGGNLYLVNAKTGLTEIMTGDDLAGLLVNNGIRMVVFNSCRGAHVANELEIDGRDRNLADALVSRGIPAVLAMAEKIPDDVALTLTRLFYRNLKQGYPIDLSLSRARQGLISAYGSHQLYWALPVLYLHPECDGYLFSSDRSQINPADRLLLSPQVYDTPPMLAGEDALADGSDPTLGLLEDDMELISRAVLLDEDPIYPTVNVYDTAIHNPFDEAIADLPFAPQFDAELSDLEDDLSFEQDEATVAELIRQLTPHNPGPESVLPANQSELLLPPEDSDPRRTLYQRLPENPAYQQPAPESATSARQREPRVESDAGVESVDRVSHRSEPRQSTGLKQPHVLLPLIGAGVVAIALAATQVLPGMMQSGPTPDDLLPPVASSPTLASPPNLDLERLDLEATNTETLATLATASFFQGKLPPAERAVEELLNRGALEAAKQALAAVPSEHLSEPSINFLRGRLAWQWIHQDGADNTFNISEARRYFGFAVTKQPDSVEYHTALGFAYYAEGETRDAIKTWCQAIQLTQQPAEASPSAAGDAQLGQPGCPLPTLPIANGEAERAYAGLALALQKLAAEPDYADQQAELLNQASSLYWTVFNSNPAVFLPDALGTSHWLWTPTLIQEWKTLGTQQPPT